MQWAREKECSSRDENTSKSSQSRWVYQAGTKNGAKEKEAKKKEVRFDDQTAQKKKEVENSAMQRAGEEKLFRLVVMPVHLHYVCLVERWLCLSGNKSEREKERELAERPKQSGPERREMAE